MIIDDAEALKCWMVKLLEPICDADPSALANYVVALVKKDKPEKDLKILCADQLDVFLQRETPGFVDKLFDCLITKDYLRSPEEVTKEIPKAEIKFPEEKLEDKSETVNTVADRDGRRQRSPLRSRLDFNESRPYEGRRRDDRRRRDAERCGKSGDSHRERRDRHAGRSRSRDGERTWEKEHWCKPAVERKEAEGSRPVAPPAAILHCANLQRPPARRCSGGPSVPGSAAAAAPIHLPDSTTESWSQYYCGRSEDRPLGRSTVLKRRCRDYDERGVCVRGDLCPFDHGSEPLIVDDVTLPRTIPLPPPLSLPPAHSHMSPPGARMPTHPPIQLPPPGIFPMADKYDPDRYNPEVPGIAVISQQHQFIPRIHSERPNLIGLTFGDMDAQNSRGANIVIQTEPSVSAASSHRLRYSRETESGGGPSGATDETPSKNLWMDKQNYSHHHKPNFQKGHCGNTKLEVRKIPREWNSIAKLNEHFCKFGTIISIQVTFNGDPETALVQYASHEEARLAISSTEAVLNNRFIKVYWHRASGERDARPGQPAPGRSLPLEEEVAGVHKAAVSTPPTPCGPSTVKGVAMSFRKVAKALTSREAVRKKQETLKLRRDMTKKKREMLKMQIECQKALISKLEKLRGVKPETRGGILKTLKKLTERTSQLKDEMNLGAGTSRNATRSKTVTDAQKELLDMELDLHKKLTAGEDASDLKQKLNRLRVEATRLGLIPRALQVAGTPRGPGWGRSRSRGGLSHMVVDHRPRGLAILGVTREEKDELVAHFEKFGEIEALRDQDAPYVVVTFKTRAEAEKAANQGAKFKGRLLQISWYTPKAASVAHAAQQEDRTKVEPAKSSLLPEDEDEDEEDKYESRSWRR